MAARFTEHGGDPAWLKSQRDAQSRLRPTRAMPYPSQTPQHQPKVHVQTPSVGEFRSAANGASNAAFVLGALLVRRALKR